MRSMSFIALLAAATVATAQASSTFARGDFSAAKRAYSKALARNPHDAGALLGSARIDLYGNDLHGAAENARTLLALRPNDEDAKKILSTVDQRERVLEYAANLNVPQDGAVLPFLQTEPLPAIELRVDGHPAVMLLDTGAPDITLDPEFAKSLGLRITSGGRGVFLGGRTALVQHAQVPRIDAGGIEIRDVNATIIPSMGMRLSDGRPIAGVAGTVFLSRFLSTIDYPNHRLILRPRTQRVPAGAADVSLPMWLVGDHFIFARGRVNGIGALFSIDSGAAGIGFVPSKATIAAAHIQTFPDRAGQGMGGGGPVRTIPTLTGEVCLGAACQRGVGGVYTPDGDPLAMFPFTVAGTVSHAFLEKYAVTFDFAAMRIILRPARNDR
jgi:predicted aspartyl protease